MNLTGDILIAMPAMGDTRFDKSVVLVCDHSEQGAMGLIVNKPMPDLGFLPLLRQLDIETGPQTPRLPIYFGGPVDSGRGFVLHSPEGEGAAKDGTTLSIGEEYALTPTRDMLERIARGEAPERVLMALGYAGWGPGQLEQEIAQNAWLTTDPTPDLIFGDMPGRTWSMALQQLGIDPLMLSGAAGRA